MVKLYQLDMSTKYESCCKNAKKKLGPPKKTVTQIGCLSCIHFIEWIHIWNGEVRVLIYTVADSNPISSSNLSLMRRPAAVVFFYLLSSICFCFHNVPATNSYSQKTGVNFMNILRAAFAPTVLRQWSTNLKHKHKKAYSCNLGT
jgi:hypothetical protein